LDFFGFLDFFGSFDFVASRFVARVGFRELLRRCTGFDDRLPDRSARLTD
jgi:hypothetical protein